VPTYDKNANLTFDGTYQYEYDACDRRTSEGVDDSGDLKQ